MIDHGGGLEETSNGSTIEKIEGDSIHSFASERALKGASSSIKVSAKLRKERLSLRERVDLEVNPPGVIWTLGYLPVSEKVVTRCKDDADPFQKVWPRFLGDAWINGYEDIINRVSLIARHNGNRDKVL